MSVKIILVLYIIAHLGTMELTEKEQADINEMEEKCLDYNETISCVARGTKASPDSQKKTLLANCISSVVFLNCVHPLVLELCTLDTADHYVELKKRAFYDEAWLRFGERCAKIGNGPSKLHFALIMWFACIILVLN